MNDRTMQGADARRIYSIARKPLAVLAMLHEGDERLARMAVGELREWADGIMLALRHERAKSGAAHWSYDLNRHIALKSALNRVDAELAKRRGGRLKRKKPRSQPRLVSKRLG